jgi:hypothetical protein
MALDSDNVRVAVTGAVYVGPTTATAPTASDSALGLPFVDLGYVSSDGITETIDRSTQQIRAWQNGALVREVVSEATYSVELTFVETKKDVLELYFGTTIVDGVLNGDPAQSGGRKSFVIDVIDGSIAERTYIPSGEVTSIGERTLASGAEIGYTVTITAYADASSVTFKKFFSSLEV